MTISACNEMDPSVNTADYTESLPHQQDLHP